MTTRGVPIKSQLSSHKLFSKNFSSYVDMVDQATLYDNNMQSSDPVVIAEKGRNELKQSEKVSVDVGGSLVVKHKELFQRFLSKSNLNENARNFSELYPKSTPK